jgi:SPX domain protein involved in polyphosphate accumulation
MKFRIEKKYKIHETNKVNFFKWLHNNNYKEIYKKRLITSIYYDNLNLQLYRNSLEGVIPRKKIRIRYYDKINEIHKEEKLTTTDGEFKDSKILHADANDIPNHILDVSHGVCYQVLKVIYDRKYFLNNNIRVTIDDNIKYNKVSSTTNFKDDISLNKCVIEFKCFQTKDFNEIKDSIPLDEIRFSKYSNAVECLMKNYFLTF